VLIVRLGQLSKADPGRAGFYRCHVDSPGDVRQVRSLECVECGRVSRENEPGWTARLTVDDEIAVYCPECDEREFVAGGGELTPPATFHIRSVSVQRPRRSRRFGRWIP
jgi:hypothetical protein